MHNIRHRLALGIVAAAFFAMPIAVHAQSSTENQTGEQDGSSTQSQCAIASNQCDEHNATVNGQSEDGASDHHTDDSSQHIDS